MSVTPPVAWSPTSIEPGVAIPIVLAAVLYTRGVRRVRRDAALVRRVTSLQVTSFTAGLVTVSIALLPPVDTLADSLFAAHMTQHVLLAAVAPPLLVAGAPDLAIWTALPDRLRAALAAFVARVTWTRRAWRGLTRPSVSCGLHFLAIWLWHVPGPYDLALHNDAVHALEHVSFVGTGMLLWWRMVYPATSRRAAYGKGILSLFVTAMQTGALGALITLSRHVLYPAQAAAAAAWGVNPLEDQQLAGLIMWVPGGLVYLVVISVLFMLWLDDVGEPGAAGEIRPV
jgi:cytochrome c oxidase assembly factor CtaG